MNKVYDMRVKAGIFLGLEEESIGAVGADHCDLGRALPRVDDLYALADGGDEDA
jgi:hypothetical protein